MTLHFGQLKTKDVKTSRRFRIKKRVTTQFIMKRKYVRL